MFQRSELTQLPGPRIPTFNEHADSRILRIGEFPETTRVIQFSKVSDTRKSVLFRFFATRQSSLFRRGNQRKLIRIQSGMAELKSARARETSGFPRSDLLYREYELSIT